MRNGKLMTKRLAAIALSSMMVMSMGMTAFASAPTTTNDGSYDNTQGPVFGGDAWDIQNGQGNIPGKTNYLDGVEMVDKTAPDGSKLKTYKKANFKKTITLRNLINKDYIPTVPDVNFDYDYGIVTGTPEKETHKVLESGATDVKDGEVLVHDGIPGVLKMAKPNIEFDSTDDATADNDGRNDVITKLVGFELDETPLQGKDTGIYRYYVIESDAKMNANERTNILESIDNNKLQGRVIDIVLSKVSPVPTDDTRAITGIIMREAVLVKVSDGVYKTTWIDEELKTDGFTEDSGEHWKGENGEIPYTLYTTYDVVFGKEITGTGLNASNSKDEFTFTITFDMNNDSKAKVVKSSAKNKNEEVSLAEDTIWTAANPNGISQTVTLKGTERFQISGIPAGVTYTIKEGANDYTKNIYKTNIEGLDHDKAKGAADRKFIDLAQTPEYTKKIVDAAGGVDRKNETDPLSVKIKKLAEGDDIQNTFIVNQLDPVTITGVVMNVAPYALMVIAAAIFAGLFISKKRQEEEI